MAYHVLSLWFVNLKLADRKKYIDFILQHVGYKPDTSLMSPLKSDSTGTKETTSTGEKEKELDENGELVVDLVSHYSMTNLIPISVQSMNRRIDGVKMVGLKWTSWFGNGCLVSISQSISSAPLDSEYTKEWVLIRRPCGSFLSETKHLNPMTDNVPEKGGPDPSQANIDPAYVVSPLRLPLSTSITDSPPVPNDDAFKRALSVLDLTPVMDSFKIGVVFVDKDQSSEKEILSNTCGSKLYTHFLSKLGIFSPLLGSSENTAGLDTSEAGIDGEFFLSYKRTFEHVVYHVPTLMPTRKEDKQCVYKKRHIGNNFCTIVSAILFIVFHSVFCKN